MKLMRRAIRTVALVLAIWAMMLPSLGITQDIGKSPLPNIDRRTVTIVSGAIVEPPPLFPIELPEPGPSSKSALLPEAESARQRGLKAASVGNWPAAVAAFKEATQLAYCSPPLMFNLALAYQRGGWPVQAVMWYRAYLAALPEAPNAPAVRAEIPKLIAEIENLAMRALDEAEVLAEKLPATPPAAGEKSLRQRSLEEIGNFAYLGGLTARAEALHRKALRLPNAIAPKEQYFDRHGLYAAAYAWDAKRVEDILVRFSGDYTREYIFNQQVRVLAYRREWAQLRKVVDAFPSGLLSLQNSDAIRQPGGFELLEMMHNMYLNNVTKEIYNINLFADLHRMFWGGRPDIAQRVAQRVSEHYRKTYPSGHDYDYSPSFISNALIGNSQASLQLITPKLQPDYKTTDVAAMYMAASMSPADAEKIIMAMIKRFYENLFISTGHANIPEERWYRLHPMAYFAMSILKGDSANALKYLARDDPLSDKEYQTRAWNAMSFAIATGRTELAFDIAERLVHRSSATLSALNRMASHPSSPVSIRERALRYGTAMTGGWRPTDANHAKNVWLRLRHAFFLNNEKQYGALPENVEKKMKEEPEKLPTLLATHAIVLWMGAMAARLEE